MPVQLGDQVIIFPDNSVQTDPFTGTVYSASTANNMQAGANNQLLYQSSPNVTNFIGSPTLDYSVLTNRSKGFQWENGWALGIGGWATAGLRSGSQWFCVYDGRVDTYGTGTSDPFTVNCTGSHCVQMAFWSQKYIPASGDPTSSCFVRYAHIRNNGGTYSILTEGTWLGSSGDLTNLPATKLDWVVSGINVIVRLTGRTGAPGGNLSMGNLCVFQLESQD